MILFFHHLHVKLSCLSVNLLNFPEYHLENMRVKYSCDADADTGDANGWQLEWSPEKEKKKNTIEIFCLRFSHKYLLFLYCYGKRENM